MVQTSKPRDLTQREMDEVFLMALRNSTPRALRDRGARERIQRDLDAIAGRVQQRRASDEGVKARLLWTSANQHRLYRVFA